MTLLNVSGIHKQVERGFSLQDINFEQNVFENIAIAGETGSGKSTLLKIIAGLVQPDGGTVHINGDRVKGPEEKLVAGHQLIAYLSQQFELPPFLRVEQVLSYANTLQHSAASNLWEICRISHLLKRNTDQLSGGERQRIALARLLSTSPRLLLLDEPFSNLDLMHKQLLKAVIRDIGEQLSISSILISHDPLDTLSWADKILIMKEGRVQQVGTSAQVYQTPVNVYAAGLFGKYNLLPPALATAFVTSGKAIPKSKSMLVRPEDIKITSPKAGTLKVTVYKVVYYGGYYEVEVRKGSSNLILRAEKCLYKPGEAVHIKLTTNQQYYL